jgi:two-component system sensor histidine kinase TctE
VIVHGEAMLLGEMIGNLIDNSIAYAGAGAETTVSVRTEGDAVILAVSDSGQGVPPDSLPRLLHRFDRLRSDKPGAGLGLSIVHEIATLFGATVHIQSGNPPGFRVSVRFEAPSAPDDRRET